MPAFPPISDSGFAPCPHDFNLAQYVLGAAQSSPDRVALELLGDNKVTWSFGDLEKAVLATAAGFCAMGINPGDKILLRLGNSVDFPIAYLGAIAVGIIPVPASPMLTAPELAAMITALKPALICLGEAWPIPPNLPCPCIDAAALRALREGPTASYITGDPNRLAYIIFTSGTSGTPRAVMHAHRAIWARRMMWQGWYELRKEDRLLHAGAFNWTYTLGTGLFDPWAQGACALIPQGTADRHALPGLIRDAGATLFAAAPGIYRQMLGTEADLTFPQLRHGLSAGEKLPEAVRDAWRTRSGTEIYEAMGMTEVSTFISASPKRPAAPGSLGYGQAGRVIAVLDKQTLTPLPAEQPGILAISENDPGLMLGYLDAPQETAAKLKNGWFMTGDMVKMAKDGAISFLGRSDDMMNAGGYRVSPLEVEAVLNQHPDIAESAAAAVMVKRDTWLIAAFYRANKPLDQNKLSAFCAARLAKYKCPRLFVHLEALPKGANGKLRRAALKQIYEATL